MSKAQASVICLMLLMLRTVLSMVETTRGMMLHIPTVVTMELRCVVRMPLTLRQLSWLTPIGTYSPPNVLSISYGYDEGGLDSNYEARQCYEYMKLGLAGTTVLFSSGDYGKWTTDSTQ